MCPLSRWQCFLWSLSSLPISINHRIPHKPLLLSDYSAVRGMVLLLIGTSSDVSCSFAALMGQLSDAVGDWRDVVLVSNRGHVRAWVETAANADVDCLLIPVADQHVLVWLFRDALGYHHFFTPLRTDLWQDHLVMLIHTLMLGWPHIYIIITDLGRIIIVGRKCSKTVSFTSISKLLRGKESLNRIVSFLILTLLQMCLWLAANGEAEVAVSVVGAILGFDAC